MALIETNPEHMADLICKGIASDLEKLIKAKLQAMIDPTISALARDLAWNTAVNVQSYIGRDPQHMEPRVVVNLQFNNQKVVYCETSGIDAGRELFVHSDGRTELRKVRPSESGLV
jgi:hypothetical protein